MKQKEKTSDQRNITANDLLFISDVSLRKKIIESIETISGLYLVEQDAKYPKELTKEIRRIIVLYSASILEALLLFLYKKNKYCLENIKYQDVHQLPSKFQPDTNSQLIIARQVKTIRSEREIMLDILLKLFLEKKIISESLAKKIKKAKDVRNTFHLSKSRLGLQSSHRTITLSTEAIYETILLVKNTLVACPKGG